MVECHNWIENAAAVIGKETIDFASDPPPDVAIEIDMTSSSFDKLAVYAALGVPEVWQYDGQSLRAVALQSTGDDQQADRSLTFPDVPLDQLARFLERWNEMDETAWVKTFRHWVRKGAKR